jgi:hypothetical protein
MTNPEQRREIIEKMQKLADDHGRETRHVCVVNKGADGGLSIACAQCDYRVNEVHLAEIGAKGG